MCWQYSRIAAADCQSLGHRYCGHLPDGSSGEARQLPDTHSIVQLLVRRPISEIRGDSSLCQALARQSLAIPGALQAAQFVPNNGRRLRIPTHRRLASLHQSTHLTKLQSVEECQTLEVLVLQPDVQQQNCQRRAVHRLRL